MQLITNLADRLRVDKLFTSPVKSPTFKVHFAVCSYKKVELSVAEMFARLMNCPDPKIVTKSYDGDALIDRLRSKVASRFLETDRDILWFWDEDVISDTENATRMMWQMWKYDLDILGAPYPLRSETEKCFAIRTLEDKGSFPCGKGGEIHEVRYVSTGCMGIRRRVFEKMIEKEVVHRCNPQTFNVYPFFKPMEYNHNGQWLYLSEDWAFCQRARNLGFKVHCDFGNKLGHKDGNHIYTFDDFFRKPVEKRDSFVYGVDIKFE